MAVISSQSENIHAQIAQLQRKIKLSNSQEQKAMFTDEINKLKKKLREINRKAPKVVAIKDAATVGEKMEAKLNAVGSSSYLRSNRAVLI